MTLDLAHGQLCKSLPIRLYLSFLTSPIHYSKDKLQRMYGMHIFLRACCLSFEKLLGDEDVCIYKEEGKLRTVFSNSQILSSPSHCGPKREHALWYSETRCATWWNIPARELSAV